jgi:hypothetical protein
MFRLLRLIVAGAMVTCGEARANYLDDIGMTALRAQLGIAIPIGSGVGVSQIEASVSGTASIYMPDILQPEFAGKTITARSGASTASGHATTVGFFFYGTASSLSPGVTAIDVYEANKWIRSGALNFGFAVAPLVESRRIQNHSWIGTVDNGGPIDVELLRRFDFAIQRDDFLAAVGLNNGSGSGVPALLANAYNAISVGLTNGDHSSGSSTVDGAGRVKPEIVAPQLATSFATPLVSSAAALLRQSAPAAAQHSITLKALLLAGATKDPFANWSRTIARPLDAHFGAGQLNVFHSYNILAASQQPASGSVLVGRRGWDFNTTNGTGRLYFFDIPAGENDARFAAVVTWNRIVADNLTGVAWGNLSSAVGDLSLRIFAASGFTKGVLVDESTSSVDNVEHLFASTLAPGRYALEVTAAQAGIAYGLAWNTVANVSISATGSEAAERGLASGVFTITRSGDLTNALTVGYTVGGSGTPGADYAALPATLTIPANAASATLTVMPVSDSLAEGAETVTVTLAPGLAATFADANATVTIQDQPIDAWRFSQFNPTQLNDPAISGDLADFDRDGIVTLVEYALGLDPKIPNASGLPVTVVGPGGAPELTYSRSANAVDVNYIPEFSTDLLNWNSVPLVTPPSPSAALSGVEMVVVASPATLSAEPVQFMRLRVTRQ